MMGIGDRAVSFSIENPMLQQDPYEVSSLSCSFACFVSLALVPSRRLQFHVRSREAFCES